MVIKQLNTLAPETADTQFKRTAQNTMFRIIDQCVDCRSFEKQQTVLFMERYLYISWNYQLINTHPELFQKKVQLEICILLN